MCVDDIIIYINFLSISHSPFRPLDTSCVLLKAPKLKWAADDCLQVKDFICEQTRCYYYNYGSIPVSASQG